MAVKNRLLQAQVAERLRHTREALEMGKTEIAAELSISKQRWGNYESGKRPFDIDVAVVLCLQKRVTLDWLFMGDDTGLPAPLARKIRKAKLAYVRQYRAIAAAAEKK